MKLFSTTLFASVGMVVLMGAGCAPADTTSNTTMSDEAVMMDEKSDDMMMDEKSMEEGVMMEDEMMKEEMMDEKMMMKSEGAYETYSAEKVSQAGEEKVVLFFRASWCPSCKAVDADIRANLSGIPESVTILDVNYDDSEELQEKYGVTYQHTFVQVDAKGNEIAQWSGSTTLASVVAQIK